MVEGKKNLLPTVIMIAYLTILVERFEIEIIGSAQ